jgi:putative nucleotidyltransferase with HDIG domain
VNASQEALEAAYVNFMGTLAEALDARDPYTAGHSRRVADYSVRIARAMGMDEAEMETLRIGAMLHDIGKIGVPDRILHKHEKLTDEEFSIIQQHPVTGKRILERIGRFEMYWPIVELHHENHDGSGYPHGLKREEIPLAARIVHVADAYDAMTSDRPYRQRMPEDKVRRILSECAGTQFDPVVTEVFLNIRIEVLTAISVDLEKLSHAITVFQDPATLPAAIGAGGRIEGAGGERGSPHAGAGLG